MTLYEHWKANTGGSFTEGVQLLASHGRQSTTPIMMERLLRTSMRDGYIPEYERGKLEHLLRASQYPVGYEAHRDEPADEPDPPPVAPAKPKASPQAIALHKQHSYHHALLTTATDDATRAMHARIIMQDIIPALDAEYDRIRAGGAMEATVTAEEPDSSADTLRRLQVVRVRLSKLKHLIPGAATAERRRKLETEQSEKEAEKARLEHLLNG